MTGSIFVKDAEISVIDENEPYRKVTLLVRLGNEDISERAVIVTAEIMDAQQRLVTACCKRAFLEGMGTVEADLAVFLAQPKFWNEKKEPYLYQAQITVQEYEKELDCLKQTFHVQG